MRVNGVKHIPENCRAKPCLLVKKSVVNCRLTELKVLWRSGGSVEPLSSLRSTPPSWGPSQIRKTSCTSSVWKTRKCNLWSYTNKHNIRQFRLKKLIVGWKREKERKQSYLQYLAPRGKKVIGITVLICTFSQVFTSYVIIICSKRDMVNLELPDQEISTWIVLTIRRIWKWETDREKIKRKNKTQK